MKIFLSRLFKRENLVALVLVATAIISIFEIPQRFGVSDSKVILILIGFLAIDSLIEKIGYLDDIEKRLTKFESLAFPYPNSIAIVNRNTIVPPFQERVLHAKSVFIFAMSANTLLMQYSRDIEKALRQGTKIRFVLVAPDNPSISSLVASSPTSSNEETQISWIHHTVDMLREMRSRNNKVKLELRFFHGLPSESLIGYDVENESGYIQVEQIVHRQTPASRPLYLLRANSNREWFNYYRSVIEEIWTDSKEVSLLRKKLSGNEDVKETEN